MAFGQDILTHSRMACFKDCRERHRLRYDCRIGRVGADTKALRMGGALHLGIEALANGRTIDDACALIRQNYATVPGWADTFDWLIEREICLRLLAGYEWRWSEDPIEHVRAEAQFRLPIVNPQTGRSSRTFVRSGKIDGIVRRDGRLAVRETKTTSESIAPDSDYWPRLAIDSQIAGYVQAARAMGYAVETVFYDVIRKPGIAPKQVPLKDDMGFKIVLDRDGRRVMKKGGLPRESGSTEDGYTLQVRVENPQEFGDRLTADIGERPDFYFARREIALTPETLAAYDRELWSIANDVRAGECYRNTSACLNPYVCEFTPICFNGIEVGPDGPVPDGFERRDWVHPELEDMSNDCTTDGPAADITTESPAAAGV